LIREKGGGVRAGEGGNCATAKENLEWGNNQRREGAREKPKSEKGDLPRRGEERSACEPEEEEALEMKKKGREKHPSLGVGRPKERKGGTCGEKKKKKQACRKPLSSPFGKQHRNRKTILETGKKGALDSSGKKRSDSPTAPKKVFREHLSPQKMQLRFEGRKTCRENLYLLEG